MDTKEKQTAPSTIEELTAAIQEICEQADSGFDEQTIAASLAAQTAFNYVVSKYGFSGHQANWAAMNAFTEMIGIKGGFIYFTGEQLLYPQYDDLKERIDNWTARQKAWLRERAMELIVEDNAKGKRAAPGVRKHWETLVGLGASELEIFSILYTNPDKWWTMAEVLEAANGAVGRSAVYLRMGILEDNRFIKGKKEELPEGSRQLPRRLYKIA